MKVQLILTRSLSYPWLNLRSYYVSVYKVSVSICPIYLSSTEMGLKVTAATADGVSPNMNFLLVAYRIEHGVQNS